MNYRRAPPAGPILLALVILAMGMGGHWYYSGGAGFQGEQGCAHGNLILAVSIVVSGLIIIAATAKLWFRHLWHKRKVQR